MNGVEIYAAITFGFTAVLVLIYLIVFKVLRKGDHGQTDNTDQNEE